MKINHVIEAPIKFSFSQLNGRTTINPKSVILNLLKNVMLKLNIFIDLLAAGEFIVCNKLNMEEYIENLWDQVRQNGGKIDWQIGRISTIMEIYGKKCFILKNIGKDKATKCIAHVINDNKNSDESVLAIQVIHFTTIHRKASHLSFQMG